MVTVMEEKERHRSYARVPVGPETNAGPGPLIKKIHIESIIRQPDKVPTGHYNSTQHLSHFHYYGHKTSR
jgi:hypothetical protein